jgi:hypothetical protein
MRVECVGNAPAGASTTRQPFQTQCCPSQLHVGLNPRCYHVIMEELLLWKSVLMGGRGEIAGNNWVCVRVPEPLTEVCQRFLIGVHKVFAEGVVCGHLFSLATAWTAIHLPEKQTHL